MKSFSKIITILMLAAVLLVSCGPVTAVPTATLQPTNTFLPANTSFPEPSATATLSQVEKIFSLPTMHLFGNTTPTAIATPLSHASIQLRSLTEEEALNLIFRMNEYSYKNFPPNLGWWEESQFIASQEPVAMAIQEFLYRFPESASANRLRWQLAFINSIMYSGLSGNQFDDNWIVGQLQDDLTRGVFQPDELEGILDKYWFDVDYFQPVENLFGDGRTAWFYVISPQVWQEEENYPTSSDYFGRGGLFVVVRELKVGQFQLHMLENAWSFSAGSSSLFEISDHNNNGIPEIALNIVFHSGTMCAGNFKIFEWRDDSFIDLTRGEFRIGDCSDYYEYAIVGGEPEIIGNQFFDKLPSLYIWNGTYYEFSGYEYSNIVEKWSAVQSSPEEADAIEAILSSDNKDGLSSSQFDFLRYRLGIVYALNSDVPQVKRVLQDLINNPSDTSRTIYSDFARNFLRYYSGDQSVALACKKSREIFDGLSDGSMDDEELFGISYDPLFGPGLLRCFDRDVFELLVNKMSVGKEDIANELRKNGMNLYYAEKRDVNLDGLVEEWLIVIDDGIFVVVPDGSHYKAIELEYFWYGEDVTQYSNVNINISRWVGVQNPVITVLTDQELDILSIDNDYISTELGYAYDLKEVLFASQDNPASYQVFSIKPDPDDENYYGVPWIGYRWDSEHQEFRDDLIEYRLFFEHNPDKAVELADVVLPLLIEWKDLESVDYWLPRYFYLSALSYEFSGETQKAAEVYWQLWHDFPESHYALMARYKLELTNP